MDEALNLENRRNIYQFVAKHPGTHVREMERGLGMQTGLLAYHLDYMEKRQVLRVEEDGYYKRYFPADRFHLKDRQTMSVLRQRMPRKIIMHLILNGPSSFQQLQVAMGISKSTLSYHLKRLSARSMIVVSKREKESIYSVEDLSYVADLLVSLRESLESDAVDRFADIWGKLGGA